MKAVAAALAAVVLSGTLAACSGGSGKAAAPSSTSSTRGDGTQPCDTAFGRRALDIRYARPVGARPAQTSLDVYTPSRGCPAPVVVWVHGGDWITDDKRDQMVGKIVAFTTAGYVLASVNYRLAEPQDPEGVMYPAFNRDVAAAVAWVRAHIARYGGDPARIALVGQGAGAGIAAAVATDARYLRRHGLRPRVLAGVVALDPVGLDLRVPDSVTQLIFGPDPAVWSDASPITHVAAGRGIPPFLLAARGGPERRVPLVGFADALRDAAVPVSIVEAGTLGEAQLLKGFGGYDEAVVTPRVMQFLKERFA